MLVLGIAIALTSRIGNNIPTRKAVVRPHPVPAIIQETSPRRRSVHGRAGQIAYQGSAFQGSLRCDDRVMLALIKAVGNVPISEVKFFRCFSSIIPIVMWLLRRLNR